MLRTTLAAAGLALAGGLGVLAANAAEPAGAQSEFKVTAEQLRINQRISQAGVRRSNEALARLDAVEVKVNAPAPAAEPAPAAPQPPLVATYSVSAQRPFRPGEAQPSIPPLLPGETTHGPEPVGIERVQWPAEGTAWVVLKGSPRKCTMSVTPTEGPSVLSAHRGLPPGAPPNAVQVNMSTPAGLPQNYSFDLVVFCPPPS